MLAGRYRTATFKSAGAGVAGTADRTWVSGEGTTRAWVTGGDFLPPHPPAMGEWGLRGLRGSGQWAALGPVVGGRRGDPGGCKGVRASKTPGFPGNSEGCKREENFGTPDSPRGP